MKIAQDDSETLSDVKITDFKRDNGWFDENNQQQYDVRYKYNLRLEKPLAYAILDEAKSMQESMAESQKSSAMQSTLQNLSVEMTVNQWINAQGEKFPPRLAALIKDCQECGQYVASEANATVFASAWEIYEKYGFQDDAKIDSAVQRMAWDGFAKTENGWLPVDNLNNGGNS